MRAVTVTAEGVGDLYVGTERDGGPLAALGIDEQTPLDAFACPDCGRVQFFARGPE